MQSRNQWFLLLVVALTALSGWFYSKTKYNYGLDIRGGVRLTYQMDTSGLKPDQQKDTSSLQDRLKGILESRFSKLGVVEGSVAAKGSDQFIIELPGFTNADEARQVFSTTAKVIVYHAKSVSTRDSQRRYVEAGDSKDPKDPVVYFAKAYDPSKVFKPSDPEYQDMIKTWDPIVEGDEISDAKPMVDANGTKPEFFYTSDGARKMEAWSRRFMNKGELIANVLDGKVLNIAALKDGAILGDTSYVDGSFDASYVNHLTDLVRSGALPVPLKELAFEQVDPTIGPKALTEMLTAAAVSMGLICVFLIAYYAFPGIVATVALLLYTLFTLTVLKMIGATFSLPAIAAFVLSVAMAVDANILVFERIKEEIRGGKPLNRALSLGFNRALTAILDSNACTIITSLVLWWFGTGLVRGFATTLIIGVVISFFTAVTVTRSLLLGVISLGVCNDPKYFAPTRSWFGAALEDGAQSKVLDVIQKSKRWFLLSGLVIVPGLIGIAMGGIKPNVEFQGGFEATAAVVSGTPSGTEIEANLAKAGFKGANVKFATLKDKGQDKKIVYVTVPPNSTLKTDDPAAKQKLATAAGIPNQFDGLSSVSATIREATVRNAVYGVLLSSTLIILYLAFRFGVALGGFKNGIKFGISAVAALLHDVLFVVGMSGLCGLALGWEVSALFITAMLTVIGFSVHDTIIIFDRIREHLHHPISGETFEHVVNKSITQSFARSINTSATAIVTLIILIAVGTPTPELKFMCVTMLLGIMVGTYSSIYNASPILYLWDLAVVKSKGAGAGLLSEAAREAKQLAASTVSRGVEAPAADGKASAYGQVRRRRSVKDQASHEIDEE